MTVQDAHHAVVVSGGEISDVKPGMINDVKNLYQSKPGDAGRTTWVDEYPDDLVAAAENAESAKYALLIRNKKCYSGRRSLEIDSIIVQSPLLKVSLRKVLKGYPGITTDLERLVFAAPFEPFVHRWKALVRLLEDESDLEAKAHLSLLYRTLEVELRDDLRALDDCISNGVITYSTCWMLFEPGALVFGIRAGQPAVARLKESHYVSNQCGEFLSLSCALIDWDGENFGYGTASFEVGAFAGTAVITKLSALPLSYHPHLNRMKAELVERGRFFQALSGYHYKYYQGIAIGHGLRGPIKYNVSQASAKPIIKPTNLCRLIAVLLSIHTPGIASILIEKYHSKYSAGTIREPRAKTNTVATGMSRATTMLATAMTATESTPT